MTPDRLLVTGLRDGRPDAFQEAFRRHHRAMLAAACSCAPRSLAEEAVQEAWAVVPRGVHGFHGQSLRAWLCAIARHKAIDAVRRDARQGGPERADDGVPELPASAGESPVAIAEARETVREIGRAMRELPHGDQRALRSRAIGTTSDTAAQLGVSTGAARIRVHRARVRLLAQLAA